MRADSRLTGFSQKTALPALTARSMRSAWVSVGVQMATASIALSSMIASIVATLAPVAAASDCGGLGIGIGDHGQLRARVVGNVAAVDLADPPGPEKRHRQHVENSLERATVHAVGFSIHSWAGSLWKRQMRRGPAMTLR